MENKFYFQWQNYLKLNKDLKTSGIKTEKHALQHFLKHGINEGRKFHEFFNWKAYLDINYDLKKVGILNEKDAYKHFVNHGQHEKRKFHRLFIWKHYLELNEDLKRCNLRNEIETYQHYINHGQSENRRFLKFFDWKSYLLLNEDLIKVNINNERDAYNHYMKHGQFENRKFFDWKIYLKLNKDLQKSGINTENDAYQHFVNNGIREKRPYGDLFNWKTYLELNKDLQKAGINSENDAFKHYITNGKKEGRPISKTNKISQNVSNLTFKSLGHFIELNLSDINHKYKLEKNCVNYISFPINFYNYIDSTMFNNKQKSEIYLVNSNNTILPVFKIYTNNTKTITLEELLTMPINQNVSYTIGYFGKNLSHNISDNEIINLYYSFGRVNFSKKIIGIELFYERYLNYINTYTEAKNLDTKSLDTKSLDSKSLENNSSTFNKYLMKLCISYYYGFYKKEFDSLNTCLNYVMAKNIFHSKNCLIASKSLHKFGGVQKTTNQLLQILDYDYNVEIIAHDLHFNLNFKFETDYYPLSIQPSLILKIKTTEKCIDFINKSNYSFILINKLDSFTNILNNINKPVKIINHNSMDYQNNLIINNKNKFTQIFTINKSHKNLLNYKKIKNVDCYRNFSTNKPKVEERLQYTHKICFVGRFSKEKNIDLLIKCFEKFTTKYRRVKLYLIGDGILNFETSNNIINVGYKNNNEIQEFLKLCDYIVMPSYSEGIPFAILEAFSLGIPCIYSKINGSNELVVNKKTGFLFELKGYNNYRASINWNVYEGVDKYFDENVENLYNCLEQAYSINIQQWNKISNTCYEIFNKYYSFENVLEYNRKLLSNELGQKYNIFKKYKIFINFQPNFDIPYGGGNISTYYLVKNFENEWSNFKITYELEHNIDIYLIIDTFKDNKFKKYSLEDVINFNNIQEKPGKILYRVNDCDKTRTVNDKNSREQELLKHIDNIDHLIYNSEFIKNYYISKYKKFKLVNNNVVYNGCDQNLYKNLHKQIDGNIRIATHHWSNNMHKGYETYYKLWKFCQSNDKYDFVFFGKNVPDMFKEVPISTQTPEGLNEELNKCHIYITDSVYDSCPNHVIEAISCGLPILYCNKEGGGRNLCERFLPKYKIGEKYDNFDDLITKLNLIRNNYQQYRDNINLVRSQFSSSISTKQYNNIIYKLKLDLNEEIHLPYKNNVVTIENIHKNSFIQFKDETIKLSNCKHIFALSNKFDKSIRFQKSQHINYVVEEFRKNDKLENNDRLNIFLSSDHNYFVGLFACLQSVINNTKSINDIHFNFMIDVKNSSNFTNMLHKIENINRIKLNKTIIYIDENILDSCLFNNKVNSGGGHLLNLGNFSRLVLGEFFNYDKLIYLDSDSIVQYDIYDRVKFLDMRYDLYSLCGNIESNDNSKRIFLKLDNIINCNYNWKRVIGKNIDKNDFVFMGAPFITNCKKWKNVYDKTIEIIKLQNENNFSLYKLFTMAIQNIIFYGRTGNISEVINVLPDLGSTRKNWTNVDLLDKDVLDWSGILKPWYTNGLYRNIWLNYDTLKLSKHFEEKIVNENLKNITENYHKQLVLN